MPEIRDGIPAVFGLELLWNTIGMSRGLYLVLAAIPSTRARRRTRD
jgi:hypothetical protein